MFPVFAGGAFGDGITGLFSCTGKFRRRPIPAIRVIFFSFGLSGIGARVLINAKTTAENKNRNQYQQRQPSFFHACLQIIC